MQMGSFELKVRRSAAMASSNGKTGESLLCISCRSRATSAGLHLRYRLQPILAHRLLIVMSNTHTMHDAACKDAGMARTQVMSCTLGQSCLHCLDVTFVRCAGGGQGPQYAIPMGSPFTSTGSMDLPDAPPAQQSVEESSDDEDESTVAVEATKVRSRIWLCSRL